ncbi:MAG: hypothetical protein SFW36_04460 [Leptolyngbyaceae cyanobacterium bins.59]|nr:hypothetical protein [Leptolyngbyaceae cyanobacterium bins.59]
MNAAEQAISLNAANKIASVVNLFKAKFPDARSDLKPWLNDPDTQEWVDPESIDIGFHFPGRSRLFQSRSILVQIRFHEDPIAKTYRAIGIELAGFDHQGKQWRFSTVQNWEFEGNCCPVPEIQEALRNFCRDGLDLFNSNPMDT